MKKGPPVSVELSKESGQVLEYLQDETDRGCAIVSAEFLRDVLHRMLLESLRKSRTSEDLFNSELSSFATRAKLAYVLGHIDKRQYQNLCYIMEIRNKFAHQYDEIDFKTSEIAILCRALESRYMAAITASGKHTVDDERFIFTMNVAELMSEMQLTTLSFDSPQDSKTPDKYRRKGPPRDETRS